jgi:hypothetical protein
MGKWRLNGHDSISIERPSKMNKKFKFVKENSFEATVGGITTGANKNGLIRAVFYPENLQSRSNYVNEVDDYDSYGDIPLSSATKGFMFNTPTRTTQNNCYGAQCFRASTGSAGSVMNESLGVNSYGLNNARRSSSGGTILTGRSNQNFGKTSAIKDINHSKVTTLYTRLTVNEYEPVDVTPIWYASDRAPDMVPPPRVDSDPLDRFFEPPRPRHDYTILYNGGPHRRFE